MCIRDSGATGTVESIQKNRVIVMMGLMKMTANLNDLVPTNEPLDIKKTKGVQMDTVGDSTTFESKIDLRGLTKEESLKLVESFVDKAMMTNATHLRILHGKGTGVLRDAVKLKLREYKSIARVYHCLLYTSPSPRDATLSRMPSSA